MSELFSHPFKTMRRAGSPSAGGNALTLESHIASTQAHPQYQKKGDASTNVDLSAHIDARGMEDHAAYYLRVSELETSYANYKSTTINVADVLNAANRPGNPKKAVVSTMLLKDVMSAHTADADAKYVPNTRVIVSVSGTAAAPMLHYWTSGDAPAVVGYQVIQEFVTRLLNAEAQLAKLQLFDTASVASGNPMYGKVANYNHSHSIYDLDTDGVLTALQSNVATIMGDYVTRDMLKDGEDWRTPLAEAGIYPEATDGTVEETVTTTDPVTGIETETTTTKVVNLNQRTVQGNTIYKLSRENSLVGLPAAISGLTAEIHNCEAAGSHLFADVQVTDRSMPGNNADINATVGSTTRSVTQRLVTSTDGSITYGDVKKSVHNNRSQTFFRTGHAFGHAGYITSLAAMLGVTPEGLVGLTNEEIVDKFYALTKLDDYEMSLFRLNFGEMLRWNGTESEEYSRFHGDAFVAGETYYTRDTATGTFSEYTGSFSASGEYYVKRGNTGFSVALGDAPTDAADLAAYNALFDVEMDTALTNDASSFLCGRFSKYSNYLDAVTASSQIILDADLVTGIVKTSNVFEKLFTTDSVEIDAGNAKVVPLLNNATHEVEKTDPSNPSATITVTEYAVPDNEAIFRKGLFYKTTDTTAVKGKRYFSKGVDGGYDEIFDLVDDADLTAIDCYEVITLEDVFNARSAARELTDATRGSVNVKTKDLEEGAPKIVYTYDEKGCFIVWGPWDQLATKRYVDAAIADIDFSGIGGGGFGGGVIDGVLCKDDEGNDCVTEYTKANGRLNTTATSIEYTVQNDCFLAIILKSTDIFGTVSGDIGDHLDVLINDALVAKLVDNWEGNDSGSIGLPVISGSKIVIQGADPTRRLFDTVTNDSRLIFKEFRLNSLNKSVGMPDYDKVKDITDDVTRTVLSESRGYRATTDGFVLFQANTLSQTCVLHGSVADVQVYRSGFRQAESDFFNNNGMVPVRKGDVVDFFITNSDGSALISMTGSNAPKVFFFPLTNAGSTSQGPVELPIVEHLFSNTVNNPFIDSTKVDVSKLSFGSNRFSKLGREVDLATATITTRIDVFCPKLNSNDEVILDAEGYAVPDTTKPMFQFEPLVWDSETSGLSGEDKPFSVTKTGVKAATAIVCWPKLSGAASGEIHRLILRGFNALKTGVSTPEVDSTVVPSAYTLTGDTMHTSSDYCPDEDASLASARGLTGYYIRLTAVVDPNSKNIHVNRAGLFIDGEINKDDNGNVCTTAFGIEDGEADVSYKGKTWYRYTYKTKTDCFLYASFGTDCTNYGDEIVVTINGTELDAYGDTAEGSTIEADADKQLTLPVKKDTEVCFYYNEKPVFTRSNRVDGILNGYASVIRIVEFKMSTELNPAQFPSLALRVFDIQNSSSSDKDEYLNRNYTWTEDELKQVFGSMFDLDEANVEFSAVFYTGTSVADYDTTTNKVEDKLIEMTDNGANYVHKLNAVVENNNGTKTLNVTIPQLPYFVSGATWDGANSKVVLRNQRTGIGGDLAVAAGVRMRLLMHISDRRGMLKDGDKLPNGISKTSVPVRQGDLNLNDTESGAKYAYTNELVVNTSGWCRIVANFDYDGGLTDGQSYFYETAVEAFVNNAWTVVDRLRNAVGVGAGIAGGFWKFCFPIEAGTLIRMRVNFLINGIADGSGTSLSGNTNLGDLPYTRGQQALCWVIPTSKYLNPEQNLPGSAGVIDGSIWKKADGTDEVTSYKDAQVTANSLTYTVKNDCLLSIQIVSGAVTGYPGIQVAVGGSSVGRLVSTTESGYADNTSIAIPVARGAVVTLTNLATGSAMLTVGGTYGSGEITFTEFKLRATNVVAAMPDWDTGKKVVLSSGDTVPADGWIVCYNTNGYTPVIKVNGVQLSGKNSADAQDCVGGAIPVSKGDIVTITMPSGYTSTHVTCEFYPVKMVEVSAAEASVLPDLVTVASGGTLRDHAGNMVTMNGNTTLKLPAAVAGKMRDFVVTLDVTTAGTLTWQNSDGTAFTSYMYDKRRTTDPMTETFTDGTTYQFYFTEGKTGVFRVELSEMVSPSS